jgi:A-macroglobulin TED domain/A-macroglobulin receptor binding domain
LQKALEYLKTKNAEIDEPYALALYGLASFDAGNIAEANAIAERLEKMAIAEGNAVYWKLETDTPFYGWGTPGRIETTALVLQLLIKISREGAKAQSKDLISKATMFLLKNKDRYGVWYSTQTTINVLDAFLAALAENKSAAQNDSIQILLNGAEFQNITISTDKIEPIILDLTDKLNATTNRVEIKSSSDSALMAQIVASHYIDWKDSDAANQTVNKSRALRLDYKCDRVNAEIMQDINCSVNAERVGFQGYGMLLAEIGLPPGADVSRESLQAAMDADWSLSRYDILPDRIVLYMWSKAGGTKFNFKFKPRYGINAQTPASTVYDYYNEEAKATLAPLKFEVK